MFGFTIKKNFCDGWDNLFSLVAVNIVFIFAALGLIFLGTYLPQNDLITFVYYTVVIMILSILVFAFGDQAAHIANFDGIRTLDYFKNIPSVLKDGALFGLLVSVILFASVVGIPFYFSQGTYVGIFMGAVFVWFDIFMLLAFQWFIPLRSLMHNSFLKCLKKSFIILFDNTGFTVAMAFYNLILFAFSLLFVGLAPSVAGILLANTNALRLRLYKYDYLEEHPELNTKKGRRKIPWEELIFDDRETLGPRKLKSFLFPWKE